MYALYKDGKMVGKPHSTLEAIWAEAMSQGLVVTSSADFPGDNRMDGLVNGVEIRELEE